MLAMENNQKAPAMTVDLSIVTLTWNSKKFVAPFLNSLLDDVDLSQLSCEVIVIDNGSNDGTLEELKACGRGKITVVPLGRNTGTTFPRNIGIRMASGSYILILDSDTVIPNGFLQRLVDSVQGLEEAGMQVGLAHPRLEYPNGDFQESARKMPTLLTKIYRLFRLEGLRRRNESVEKVLQGSRTTVDYAISAAWIVPRSTFDSVGLLDESIFYSPEDVEFCLRCWQHKLPVWYLPDVRVVHDCQRITSKKPLSRLGLSHTHGLFRLWLSYGGLLRRPAFLPSADHRNS